MRVTIRPRRVLRIGFIMNAMESTGFEALLYYHFVAIDDPEALARDQLDLCVSLGLLGRILVAHEGLNGTVSGPAEACAAYRNAVSADPRFADLIFKIDAVAGHVFQKLSVKVRNEIVTLGAPLEQPVHVRTGKRLAPRAWADRIREPGAIIIDGRNDYEFDVGRFPGAIRPPVGEFKSIPQWIETLGIPKSTPIYTYCTGGVRCEKLTALMLQEGYEDVYQLDGGIVAYGKDPEVRGVGFDGACFVFDDRIVTPVDTSEDRPIVGACAFCHASCERYINCANVDCNRLYLCCPSCDAATQHACSPECAIAERRREPRKKFVAQSSA